ncbi:MAG TPA: PASTA domain-containing protein [Gemmatimonadales bacterium]|nr:PASTA domain-containing protein [Gemmatimonadales bacterium]
MRIRRHTGASPDRGAAPVTGGAGDGAELESEEPRGEPWKRFARDMGLVALVALIGYLLSGYWISPGAVFASEHAVPRVLELPVADARERLGKLGFRVRVEAERANSSGPPGAVVWQDPPPETVVPPNSTVQLVLSGGPAPVNVPDVVGLSLPYAESIIEASGLKLGRVDRVASGQEAEVVLSVRPPPGSGRPPGSRVELLVSTGQGGGQ